MTRAARILVVDDEPNLCLLYREAMESEGYSVRTTCDAAQAMRLIDEETPDVVILDIRMPRMDGIEAMGRMLARRNDLKVVLNSAYSSYRDDFRSWPAEEYVIKSADLGELKSAVRRALVRGRQRAAAEA